MRMCVGEVWSVLKVNPGMMRQLGFENPELAAAAKEDSPQVREMQEQAYKEDSPQVRLFGGKGPLNAKVFVL